MDFERQLVTDEGHGQVINRLVSDLFSFDSIRQQRVLKYYYYNDVTFTSPLVTTATQFHIRQILLVWKVLNRYPPIIDKICMEGPVCIVFMTQILCPRLFPFISNIKLPVLVRLEFKETDTDSGLFKIATHQESWTIQGLIEAVPCLSFWYNTILRNMMGKIISTTGSMIETAQLMSARSLELEECRKVLLNNQIQQRKN